MLAPPKRRPKRAPQKVRLRELSVQKAKAKSRPYLVWDALQRGLALRVYPTGSKAWACVYSRHGRPRWLTLGNAEDIGLADARMMAGEAMLAVAKGKDPAAEKKAQRGAGTFGEMADRYLEFAKTHNKSWAQGRALVERHAIPRWGELQAAAITRGDVVQMKARIAAPIVANQTLAAVSAIFTWGIKQEIVTVNPCKLVDRTPVRGRERILSESEIATFWQAFTEIGGNVGAALKAILLTGQRPGEISAMRREHIVDGWWNMPGEAIADVWPGTKNKASHRLWLSAPVQALIAELGADRKVGYVFGSPRGAPPAGLDAIMRELVAKLGIEPKATPHDLRRTFASLVAAGGHGRQAMDRILNHADRSVGSIYDRHHYGAEDRAIMEATAARIMALVEGRPAENVLTFAR
jgi:integrase